MRIAIVSDIHGNLPALEAVIEDLRSTSPDLVVHAGDVASHGSSPAEVIDVLRELRWPGVRGNTDEMLWNPDRRRDLSHWPVALHGLRDRLFDAIAPATIAAIGPERLEWLSELPVVWRGFDLGVVHATPDDLWRAPRPDAADPEFRSAYGSLGVSRVVYGHIHRPFVRHFGALTVANAGSVSLSYDGDTRASYALADARVPVMTTRRVTYDVQREIDLLNQRGYPHVSWLAEMLRRGRFVGV